MRKWIVATPIVHRKLVGSPHFAALEPATDARVRVPKALRAGRGIMVALGLSAVAWAGVLAVVF